MLDRPTLQRVHGEVATATAAWLCSPALMLSPAGFGRTTGHLLADHRLHHEAVPERAGRP